MQTNELFFTNTFDKNIEAWKQGYRFIDNRGGTRSGKNYAELQLMYIIAKFYKKRRTISVVGQTLPNLKLGAIADFKNIVSTFGENPDKYNKSDNIFKYGNSEIQFFSADNSDKVHGPARDILILNEANKIPYETADQLITRTTETVFFDYNPSQSFYVQDTILKQFPEVSKTIHTTYLDNIQNLPQHQIDYIERKKQYDPEWWKVYGLGEIGNIRLGTEYYKNFDYVRNVDEFSYDPKKPLHISFDFNVVPYNTACVYQMEKIEDIYYVYQIAEFCLKNPMNTTASVCRKIKETYLKQHNTVFIYGDASGSNRSTISNTDNYKIIKQEFDKYLTGASMRVPKSNPRHAIRREFVNECLAHVSDIMFVVDKNCKHTIEDLEKVQENAEGGKLKVKTKDQSGQSYEMYGHTSDCLDYFLMAAFKYKF